MRKKTYSKTPKKAIKQGEPNQIPLFLLMLFTLALVAILFSFGNKELNEQARLEDEQLQDLQKNLDAVPVLAKAVSVYNISQSKKIYGKNDEVPMPIASLTKIMTVAVALNSYGVNKILPITPSAINQEGDFGLFAGEKWKAYDLAGLTLISSANDGAYALWENNPTDFLEKINEKAKKIGMEHAQFLNFTGLDLGLENAGAFASAADVNTMAMYGFKSYPGLFFHATTVPEINLKSESGFIHSFKNTDPIVDKIPNLLFSKTGYTEIAGGNLNIIFMDKKGDEIAVTVLGSTFDARFSDMEKLVNVLYNY